jgi:hypothetical protein
MVDIEKFKKYKQTNTIIIFNDLEEFKQIIPFTRETANSRFIVNDFLYKHSLEDKFCIIMSEVNEKYGRFNYFKGNYTYKNHNFINIRKLYKNSIIEIW